MVSLNPNDCFLKIKEVMILSIIGIQIPSFNYFRQSLGRRYLREMCRGGSGGELLTNCNRFTDSLYGPRTIWTALRMEKEKMCFISLGTSDSGWDRLNTCMWTCHKYINNYTTKQSYAGSGTKEVGRIQVVGWRQGWGKNNFMEKSAEFIAERGNGSAKKCRKGLYLVWEPTK